jgi:signal transduction histidine kinase
LRGREYVVAASFTAPGTAGDRLPTALDEVLRETAAPAERAARIAALLQTLAPAGLSACQLADGECHWQLAEGLAAPPDLRDWLRRELANLNPLSADLMRLPGLEDRLGLSSQVAAVARQGQPWGFLMLAHPPETPADVVAGAGPQLLTAAWALAALLQLEAEAGGRQEMQDRLAETADLILLGEAVSGLTHELNNCLNSILLQASVLQLRASSDLRDDVAVIRHHGRLAASLMRPLQQARQKQRKAARPTDLNQLVREAVADEPAGERVVRLELAPRLRPLQVRREGLRNLVRWLLHTALARQPDSAGPVAVRTWEDGGRVLFAVEDAGPDVAVPILEHLFDQEEGVLDPTDLLERLAGQSFVRQSGATLHAEAKAEGGLRLTVGWG